MMIKDNARKMIIKDEGWSPKPYKCTEGIWTIGFGTNISRITKEEGAALLDLRLDKIIQYDLLSFTEELANLNDARKIVLINMLYQLGLQGVKRFKNMRKAIVDKDWQKAGEEMLDSKWHKQTPNRCERLAKIMREGIIYEFGVGVSETKPNETHGY